MAESRIISDLITCDAIDDVGERSSAPVRFLYNSADPLSVTIDCTDLNAAAHRAQGSTPGGEPVTWTFARSLLTDALVADGPYGHGDVVAQRDGAWITITLRNEDGKALLRFAHFAVLRFTQRTAALVPLGSESDHLDVDTAIARLLGGVR